MFEAKRNIGRLAMVIAGAWGLFYAVTSGLSIPRTIIFFFGALCMIGLGATGLALSIHGKVRPQKEKMMRSLVIASANSAIGLGGAMTAYGVMLVMAREMAQNRMSNAMLFIIGVPLFFGGIIYLIYAITVE